MDERCFKSKIKKEMSFLEVKNLNISYPTRKETIVASKNVEFSLERGEILGIVGAVSYTHLTLPTRFSV